MRKPRGFLSRAFAATVAIWLGLVITEPLQLDACPMHGVHSMHAMAGMGHSMQSSPSSGQQAERKASHQCTCIGDCSVGAGFGLPQSASIDLDAGVLFPSRLIAAGNVQQFRVDADHLLPFANGPPALS